MRPNPSTHQGLKFQRYERKSPKARGLFAKAPLSSSSCRAGSCVPCPVPRAATSSLVAVVSEETTPSPHASPLLVPILPLAPPLFFPPLCKRARPKPYLRPSPPLPLRPSPRPAEQPRRSAVESSSIPANQRRPRWLEASESSSTSVAGHRLSPAIPATSGDAVFTGVPRAGSCVPCPGAPRCHLLLVAVVSEETTPSPHASPLLVPILPLAPPLFFPPLCKRARPKPYLRPSPPLPLRPSPRPAEQPRRSAVESSSIPANQRRPRRLEASESSSTSVAGHRLSPAIPATSGDAVFTGVPRPEIP
nr:vegetative cell wall protein gp1-like [Lolium perenne]